jgi:predicted PhzF superfamily epimerase YddE/YHI9
MNEANKKVNLFSFSLFFLYHLSAGVAQWLIGNGVAPPSYVASQGLAMGRRGRIVVHRDDSDLSVQEANRAVWVGGQTVVCIQGTIQI